MDPPETPYLRMLLYPLAKVISFAAMLIGRPLLLCLFAWPKTFWVCSAEVNAPGPVPPIYPWMLCGKLGILVWLLRLLPPPALCSGETSSSGIYNGFFGPLFLPDIGVSPLTFSYGRPLVDICLFYWLLRANVPYGKLLLMLVSADMFTLCLVWLLINFDFLLAIMFDYWFTSLLRLILVPSESLFFRIFTTSLLFWLL